MTVTEIQISEAAGQLLNASLLPLPANMSTDLSVATATALNTSCTPTPFHRQRSKSISLSVSPSEDYGSINSSAASSTRESPTPSADPEKESGSILKRWRRKKGSTMRMSIDVPNSFLQKSAIEHSNSINNSRSETPSQSISKDQLTALNPQPEKSKSSYHTNSSLSYHTRHNSINPILITSIPASHITHSRHVSLPALPLQRPPEPFSFSKDAASSIPIPYELRKSDLESLTPSVNVFASIHRPLRFDPLDPLLSESTLTEWKLILSSPDFFSNEASWRSDPSFASLMWNGIPSEYRGIVWPYLLQSGFACANYEVYYNELLSIITSGVKTIPSQADIDKDIHRTLTKQSFFQGESGKIHIQSLRRVLYAYALHAPVVGYCQGMNFIAGALLINTNNSESITFACLTSILDKRASYYTKSMVGSMVDTAVMCDLVSYYEPELNTLLSKYGISVSNFSPSWFICLFLNSPLHFVHCMHFWDLLFYFGEEMIFYMGLAVLRYQHTRIANIFSSEEILTLFLSQLGEIDQWDLVVDYMRDMYEEQQYFAYSVSSLRDFHKYEIMAEMSVLNPNVSRKLQSSLLLSSEELQKCWELFIRPKPWETIVTDVISNLTHFRYSFCAAVFKPSATAQWKGRGLILPSCASGSLNGISSDGIFSQSSFFPPRSQVNSHDHSFPALERHKKERLQNLSAQFCLSAPDEEADSIFNNSGIENRACLQKMFPSPSNTVPITSAPSSPTVSPKYEEPNTSAKKPVHRRNKSFASTTNYIMMSPADGSLSAEAYAVNAKLGVPRKSIELPSTFSIARVVKQHSAYSASIDLPSPKTALPYRNSRKVDNNIFDPHRRNSLSAMNATLNLKTPLNNFQQLLPVIDSTHQSPMHSAANRANYESDDESKKNNANQLYPLPSSMQQTITDIPLTADETRAPFCRVLSATHDTFTLPTIEVATDIESSVSSAIDRTSSLATVSSISILSSHLNYQAPLVEPLTSSPFSHSSTLSNASPTASFTRRAPRSPLSSAVHPQYFLPVGGGENVLARLFTMLDTQNRGCIDFEEFCTGVAIFKKASREARVSAIFQMANRSSLASSTSPSPKNQSISSRNPKEFSFAPNAEDRISKSDILAFVSMFDRLYFGSRTNNFEVEGFVKMAFEKFSHKKLSSLPEAEDFRMNSESLHNVEYLTKDEFCEIIVLQPLISKFFRLDPHIDV